MADGHAPFVVEHRVRDARRRPRDTPSRRHRAGARVAPGAAHGPGCRDHHRSRDRTVDPSRDDERAESAGIGARARRRRHGRPRRSRGPAARRRRRLRVGSIRDDRLGRAGPVASRHDHRRSRLSGRSPLVPRRERRSTRRGDLRMGTGLRSRRDPRGEVARRGGRGGGGRQGMEGARVRRRLRVDHRPGGVRRSRAARRATSARTARSRLATPPRR